jgi:hypothetical protein
MKTYFPHATISAVLVHAFIKRFLLLSYELAQPSSCGHTFLERRCGMILLQYTADAELVSFSGSAARPLSTREETCSSCVSLIFSVVLSHCLLISFLTVQFIDLCGPCSTLQGLCTLLTVRICAINFAFTCCRCSRLA